MILATVGLLIYTLSVILCNVADISLNFWHLGALICGMCGHLPGLVSTLMSYLSDVVPKEKLPVRLGIYFCLIRRLIINDPIFSAIEALCL